MNRYRWLLLALPLTVVSLTQTAFSAETPKIRNEKVVAVEDSLAPGETLSLRGETPCALVYFDAGTLEVTAPGAKAEVVHAKPGEVRFEAAKARTVKNTGSAPLRVVRIDFLGKGLGETWGNTGLSPNYKMIMENQYTRVYDIRIPAGTKEPQHTHKNRVVVALSGAQLKHLMPDGREEPSTLTTGDVVWRLGGTHIGQNLGKTNLWVIAVEPK